MKNNEMSELEELRHSAAHVMAAAICRIYPNVKLDIGLQPLRDFIMIWLDTDNTR